MKSNISIWFCIFMASVGFSACNAESREKENHSFVKIYIGYPSDGCSFQSSPVDFCDEKHMAAISDTIKNRNADFNRHYIMLSIPERQAYFQRSIVAIDIDTGIVYPVPIDFYSGYANSKSGAKKFGVLKYDSNNDKVCIEGSIFVYRAEQDGVFLF